MAISRDWNTAQRQAVIEEMNLLLDHPIFCSSNRCVALLRYLVDHALSGNESYIKERTIGIEVFGRSADYDVSTDPIVRKVANDVRKRLAQCYIERGGGGSGVRIQLIRGRYLPEFEFAAEGQRWNAYAMRETAGKETAGGCAGEASTSGEQASPGVARSKKIFGAALWPLDRKWIFGAIAALLICCAAPLLIGYKFIHPASGNAAQYRVWKPLLDANSNIIICLSDDHSNGGHLKQTSASANGKAAGVFATPTLATPHEIGRSTPYRDAQAGNAITTLLMNFKRAGVLQPSSRLTYLDFHKEPVVLIGGLNNPWTPLILSKLRFSIQSDSETQDSWIQDAQNLTDRSWRIDGKQQAAPLVDYAIVTRFFDTDTMQWVIMLSGMKEYSTEAAANLVSDPKFAALIPSGVRDHGNFQIVLSTSIVDGNFGPIRILSTHIW